MTVEWYVYWIVICGLAANFWMAVKIGKLFGHLLYAAVAAASFTRFCWACGKVHGFKDRPFPHWIYAPLVWFEFVRIEMGSPARTINHMGGAGVWNGIGDWTVLPAKEAESC
jgi:hypothetical protein